MIWTLDKLLLADLLLEQFNSSEILRAPCEAGRTFDAGNINEGLGLLRGKRGLKHPGRRVGEFHGISQHFGFVECDSHSIPMMVYDNPKHIGQYHL